MPQPHSVEREPLATPWSAREDAYDVIVIGSGYGGAISAARIATARWPGAKPSVCLLERGKEWLPKQFPDRVREGLRQRFDPKQNPLGLYTRIFNLMFDIPTFQRP